MEDNVKHPKHYQMPLEPIVFLYKNRDYLDPFQANVIKYVVRYKRKNGIEDLKKAKFYLDYLITQHGLEEADKEDTLAKWDSFEPCSHKTITHKTLHEGLGASFKICMGCNARSDWNYDKMIYGPWYWDKDNPPVDTQHSDV